MARNPGWWRFNVITIAPSLAVQRHHHCQLVAVQRSPHRRRVAVQRHHHCPIAGGSPSSPLPDRWRFNVLPTAAGWRFNVIIIAAWWRFNVITIAPSLTVTTRLAEWSQVSMIASEFNLGFEVIVERGNKPILPHVHRGAGVGGEFLCFLDLDRPCFQSRSHVHFCNRGRCAKFSVKSFLLKAYRKSIFLNFQDRFPRSLRPTPAVGGFNISGSGPII